VVLNVGARLIAIKNKLFYLPKIETFQKIGKIIKENEIPSKLIKSRKELL
jgi:hypothetical protein